MVDQQFPHSIFILSAKRKFCYVGICARPIAFDHMLKTIQIDKCNCVNLILINFQSRHNDTPVVRASGRELSYVLLAGIIMCYSVTFALVLRPTDITCGVQR